MPLERTARASNSALAIARKRKQIKHIRAVTPGSNYPMRYPYQKPQGGNPLGAPLSIREAANLIGCSPWTVRQTLIPLGLPCFRSGGSSKLIFYTNQVVRWIESRQGDAA